MRQYCAIDLKSFYASVECAERGYDPLRTNLVVADESRTDKTICLAVSPALKAYGIPGRPRLFEVRRKVAEINERRRSQAPGRELRGSSYDAAELASNPALALDLIVAPPQMGHYMEASAGIYSTYLSFVAPEDIHVYSIDEVFMDLTDYLGPRGQTAREMTMEMIRAVLDRTGITATAGIGTNLYLAKVAMDIVAKHMQPDQYGARIAELDELRYRQLLWNHRPLTDFWRIGRGIAGKLAACGITTMGDIARCSLGKPDQRWNEDLLYRLFGVNAELLIDHAWGIEPCTMAQIKAYEPEASSLSTGQVLAHPYSFEKGRLIVREMTELLCLDLVEKGLVTDQMVLSVGYDVENLTKPQSGTVYQGQVKRDYYGRKIPKSAHGSVNLEGPTSSARRIAEKVMELYDRIVDPDLLVRRMYVVANHVVPESQAIRLSSQLSLFDEDDTGRQALEKERRQQQAVLELQKRFGKNAVLKGMNFLEGATTRERNQQVGGHRKGDA